MHICRQSHDRPNVIQLLISITKSFQLEEIKCEWYGTLPRRHMVDSQETESFDLLLMQLRGEITDTERLYIVW